MNRAIHPYGNFCREIIFANFRYSSLFLPRRVLAVMLGLLLAVEVWAVALPQPPARPSDGSYLPLGETGGGLWLKWDGKGNRGYNIYRWEPASGALTPRIKLKGCSPEAAVESSRIIYIACAKKKDSPFFLVAITPKNELYSAPVKVDRQSPRLLALAGGAVLVLGGNTGETRDGGKRRTAAVEVGELRKNDLGKTVLSVRRGPDMPGNPRTAFSQVLLVDGRVMVLGGTGSRYVGCNSCLNASYILDARQEKWTPGPLLNYPRADATATLLPDGNVLVAGGWTPEQDWGTQGSKTAELWNARTNRFITAPPMLTTTAMHRAVRIMIYNRAFVVLAGGTSQLFQAYDVRDKAWYVVGEMCAAHENADVVLFTFRGRQHAWIYLPSFGFCEGGAVPLRMPAPAGGSGTYLFDASEGIVLFRHEMKFSPGLNGEPSIASGGKKYWSNESDSVDVRDAIWNDGRIRTLSPHEQLPSESEQKMAPAFLQEVPPIRDRATSSSSASCPNGGVRNEWLSDGRIIVAGGELQINRIAVVTPDALNPDAVDSYIPLGEFTPERSYDIYEPATKSWRASLPALGVPLSIAFLDDGRVVQHGRVPVAGVASGSTGHEEEGILEISSPDGRQWKRMPNPSQVELHPSTACIFIIQNELFIRGATKDRGIYVVEWYDMATKKWSMIWRAANAGGIWPDVGRIIVRQLPNGKRLVIPVNGF